MDNNVVLDIKDVSFAYKDAKVLKKISFNGRKGDLLVLAGPNGSGKTTLIKLIFDLLEKQEGKILVSGEDNSNIKIKNKILYLPSDNILPDFLTGDEYVRLMCRMYEVPLDEEAYKQVAGYYGMEEHLHTMIENYSHGMTKKVQLITAFLLQTDITIVDETLNGMDIKAREVSKVLLKKLANKDKLVIMCTHDLDLAERIGNRAVLMYDGEICAEVDLNNKENHITLTDIFKDMIGFEESDYEI